MTDDLAKLAGIAWGHFVRWFVKGRVFRLAIQARTLTLASAGVLLTIFGWWLIAQVFSHTSDAELQRRLPHYTSCPWTADGFRSSFGLFQFGDIDSPDMGAKPRDATTDPWERLSAPVFQLFALSQSFVGALFLTSCVVWSAAVWGLFGGAITRSALLQLTREEPASLGSVLRHAGKRWPSYFAAPLLPLGGVCLVTLVLLLLGLLMRASLLFAGLAWPLALIGGIVMAVLMTGLSVGWPLMHATISAEGSDSFDALSRSYSYVYQRPLHYLFYVVAATILGSLGLILVNFFAAAVETLTAWSVSWGSGNALMHDALAKTPGYSQVDRWGMSLLGFWQGGVRLIVIGYAFGFFWTAISAIYLLLRHDADGAELSELYQDESPEAFGLPPLEKDAAGVPVVPKSVEPAATSPSSNSPTSNTPTPASDSSSAPPPSS
ncbi:MAG: hypothetical protein K8U03_26265 [Planctomycetia bacterium]|nr:hypothetical protein [Planctomycetia bacterium]